MSVFKVSFPFWKTVAASLVYLNQPMKVPSCMKWRMYFTTIWSALRCSIRKYRRILPSLRRGRCGMRALPKNTGVRRGKRNLLNVKLPFWTRRPRVTSKKNCPSGRHGIMSDSHEASRRISKKVKRLQADSQPSLRRAGNFSVPFTTALSVQAVERVPRSKKSWRNSSKCRSNVHCSKNFTLSRSSGRKKPSTAYTT